jgi:hypothetical protein
VKMAFGSRSDFRLNFFDVEFSQSLGMMRSTSFWRPQSYVDEFSIRNMVTIRSIEIIARFDNNEFVFKF